MRKPAIKSINFIKAVCALGIVGFHFCTHLSSRNLIRFFTYATGNYSGVFVTVFFIVSGALLYYHYEDGLELKEYAWKRWKAIYPMFYLAFLFYWIRNLIICKTAVYGPEPYTYIFTVLGIDGYIVDRIPNYNILGEWFLGAIIILYVLFPLVLRGFRKSRWLTFGAAAAVFLIFRNHPITSPDGFRSISSCLFSFVCGMMLMAYRKQVSRPWVVAAAVAGSIVLHLAPLPISYNLSHHLSGVCMYIWLSALGEFLMRNRVLCAVFDELGKLSYGVFLIHHQVILDIVVRLQPATLPGIGAVLAVTLAVILCGAKLLSLVTGWIVRKLPAGKRAKK